MTRRPIPARMLDPFDRAILRIIQADNKTPQRVIAAAVNLSAAAVQRRIAAMERSSVISRNVALVDPEAIGLTITSIVEVKLKNERFETVEAARQLFLATPEVQQVYYVTGGVSFVLVIVTADMPSYERLTRRLFNETSYFDDFRSLIALNRVKVEGAVAIPSAP